MNFPLRKINKSSFIPDYIIKEELVSFGQIKLPKTLYKYRSWAVENNKTILTKREVFFAPPSSFEDVYDCKIPKRWDLLTYGDILDKYYQDSIERNNFSSIEEHVEHAIYQANHTNITNQEYVKQHQQKEFEDHDARSGVLSLTEFCNVKDMWEKYSNNHEGFCVGFDPTIMLRDMGTAGGKVKYYPELPIIYPHPKHSFSLQMHLQTFSKLSNWTFEQEYRTYKFRYEPLSLIDRIELVPANAYKEIILGAKMQDRVIKDLLSGLPSELREIRIRKASIVNNEVFISDYDV